MTDIHRRGLLGFLAGSLVCPAMAEGAYPSRPIALIQPFQAGGVTDILARILSEGMAELLGQPIVVEARSGANGMIGAAAVARSKADGYTLLANASVQVLYAGLRKQLSFDPLEDFAPVGLLANVPLVVVVGPNSPFRSMEDVVEEARRRPGDLTFGSGAAGSIPHLAGEMVNAARGIRIGHVPYLGTGRGLTDVAGGHLPMMYAAATPALPLIEAGNLRAIAVTTAGRLKSLPDVPTLAEQGFADFDIGSWYGLWAPRDTPEPVVERLNEALRAASRQPTIMKRLEQQSAIPSQFTRKEFAAYTRRESGIWLEAIRRAGFQPE